MGKPLEIVVIGCGLIAQVAHLRFLNEHPDKFKIVGLCDLSKQRLETLGKKYEVDHLYSDWKSIPYTSIDAILIATSGSHTPIILKAFQNNVHVFSEKPLCYSVEEGMELIQASKATRSKLMIGNMKKYSAAYQSLASRESLFDSLRFAQFTTLESPFEPYVKHYPLVMASDVDESQARKLRNDTEARVKRAIGNVENKYVIAYEKILIDSLIHEINLMHGLLGEPDAITYALLTEHELHAHFVFNSAHCTVSWVDLPGIARYKQEFMFCGNDERATLRFGSPFLLNSPPDLIYENGSRNSVESEEVSIRLSYEEPFEAELIAFYDAVVSNGPIKTGLQDGVKDIAICQAIVKSALSGQAVEHPSKF